MKRTLPLALTALLSACAMPQQNPSLQVQKPSSRDEGAPPSHPSLSPYEQGVSLIAQDKSWRDLYRFLHRITASTNDLPAKLELTEFQRRFIDEYPQRAQRYKAEDLRLLHQVIPQARQTMESLSLADLVFISEVHRALRAYVNTGVLPKSQYDVETRMKLRYQAPSQNK